MALVAPGGAERVDEPESDYSVEQVQIETADVQAPLKRSI